MASLVSAVASILAVLVFATQPGTLPVGEPPWVLLLTRAWSMLLLVTAVVLPLVTLALAARDYRRSARKSAVVAAFLAVGVMAVGVWAAAVVGVQWEF